MKISLVSNRNVVSAARDLVPTSKKPLPFTNCIALGKVTYRWLLSFDTGCVRSVVFLDIKKAFDTVDHQILIRKLDHYGLQCNELDFIVFYLDNRQQCCQIESYTSSVRKIFVECHMAQLWDHFFS